MELTKQLKDKLLQIEDEVRFPHSGARRRDLKLRLLKEFGFCFWCEREVFDYGDLTFKHMPKDLATLDHIESRFFRKKGDRVVKVLSCYECNYRRGKAEEKQFYRFELKEPMGKP